MYRTLYDYFKDFVLNGSGSDYTKCLAGETLKDNPTQREASTALKTVWQKLGGTVAALLLLALPAYALTPDMHWQDVPSDTCISNTFVTHRPVTVDTRTSLADNTILKLATTNTVYYFTNLSQSRVTGLGFSLDGTLYDGVYTWEVLLSTDQDISAMSFDAVFYVGNDKSYNPDHGYARVDTARTTHVFSVRLIYLKGVQTWQIAYCYSFKG